MNPDDAALFYQKFLQKLNDLYLPNKIKVNFILTKKNIIIFVKNLMY